TKILLHDVNANGIVYLDMYIDLKCLNEKELQYLSLLTALLGKLDTQNYDYSNLSNTIGIETGGIGFNENILAEIHSEDYQIKHSIKGKSLVSKFPQMLDLISEIIFTTKFDDKDKILEIIKKQKTLLDNYLLSAGHIVAINRLNSYYSKTGKINDIIKNVGFMKFLKNILDNFDNEFENIKSNLERLVEKIYTKNGLIISLSAEKNDLKVKDQLATFIDKFSTRVNKDAILNFDFSAKNEAIPTPANIQFVAQGYNFKNLGFEYNGALKVIKTAFSVSYLIQKIRVMGGAYGAMSVFGESGNSYFCSYRDPNLTKTLEAYKGLPAFLKNLNLDERTILNYIIATIGNIDMPLTASMKGAKATMNYLTGRTLEDIQKEREQIINFDKSEFVKGAKIVEKMLDKNYFCVVGNSANIAENIDLFDSKLEL
ncbi:MAG: hypothetical protein U9N34_01500, partial [Candidatus Cloacimonadota bacterium]|nr:hypothetical protein [Candidatus Cloacimonadota bacterium]